MSARRKFVHTDGPCPHGPALPPHQYCVACQPMGVKIVTAPASAAEIPAAFRDLPDAYDAPQACASPTAATVYVTDVAINETPHVTKARRQRESA